MSYTKQTWATGDTITADKLNHIEAGIEESENKSFSVVEERTLLCEESAETGLDVIGSLGSDVYQVGFSNTSDGSICDAPEIAYDELMITINGTEYLCKKNELDGTSSGDVIYYGDNPVKLFDSDDASDISQFVFAFPKPGIPHPAPVSILLINSSAFGVDFSHIPAIKIESYNKTITPTDDFKEAVKEANPCFTVEEAPIVYFDKTGIPHMTEMDFNDNLPFLDRDYFGEDCIFTDDELEITIDGTKYAVEKHTIPYLEPSSGYVNEGVLYYGSTTEELANGSYEFPFRYSYWYGVPDGEGNTQYRHPLFIIAATSDRTKDVKIEGGIGRKIIPTDDFKEAVKAANPCYDTGEKRYLICEASPETNIEIWENTEEISSIGGDNFPIAPDKDYDEIVITINGIERRYHKNTTVFEDNNESYNIVYYGDDPNKIYSGDSISLSYFFVPDLPDAVSLSIDNTEFQFDELPTIKIEGVTNDMELSDDFKKAVELANPCYSYDGELIVYFQEDGIETANSPEENYGLPFLNASIFDPSNVFNEDELKITFDGVEYNVKKQIVNPSDDPYEVYYGSTLEDLSNVEDPEYPFRYAFVKYADEPANNGSAIFHCANEGPHDVKITRDNRKVVPSDEFKKAVTASYYNNVEKSVVYFDKHDLVPVSGPGMPTGAYMLSENDFPYETVFENEQLTITLNGEEFNVLKQFDSDRFAYYYGTNPKNISDKDADPFTYIYSADENNRQTSFICIGLAANSTVDLKIEGVEYRKEPTNEFKEAVNKANPCYTVDEEYTVYYDEQGLETISVESAYDIVDFNNLGLDDDKLTITIDGIKYVVSSNFDERYNTHYYGSYSDDLYLGVETEYPFCYYVNDVDSSFFVVTTEGPHDIKIERYKVNVEPTDAFKNAVNKSFYETTEGRVVYFEENGMATDESEVASKYYLIDFPPDLEIDNDKITIIIDGEPYTCDKQLSDRSDRIYYGEDPQNLLHGESMEYPFSYLYNPRRSNAEFLILSSGEHDILITGTEYNVVPTPEFETAVNNVYGVKSIIIREDYSDGSYIYYDKTGREIFEEASHGTQCYLLEYESSPTSFFILPLAYAEVENVDDYRIGFITPGSGNLQYLNSSGAGYLHKDAK